MESEEEILHCQWHPNTETTLRCYQCNTPICTRCAQRTPVGYICRNCKRGRQQRYEQASSADYIIAGTVALILGLVAGLIPVTIGWFTLFVSPMAGGLIAEIVWQLVRRRYSNYLAWIVGAGIGIGGLGALIFSFGGFQIIYLLLHLGLATTAAFARLRLN